ncbi:MAG TPA: AI-2E family transporter, partial [Steroidobacteraceae bacterium]|nr:AI-2E family transporter [Steroidobacteraceae bacterium]
MQVLQDERIQIDTAQAPRSPPVPEAAAAAAAGAQLARHLSRPLWIIALCALGVALHLAREALIPLILAILLALVLSGLVESLRRWQIPRGVSATLLLISAGVVAGAAVDALAAPAQEWMRSAPRVMRVIEHRVRPAQALVQRLNELAGRAAAIAGGAQPGPEAAPAGTPAAAAPLSAVEILAETGWLAGGVVTVVVLTLLILSAGPATLARMMSALNGNWQAVHVLRTIDAIRVEVGRYYGTLAL